MLSLINNYKIGNKRKTDLLIYKVYLALLFVVYGPVFQTVFCKNIFNMHSYVTSMFAFNYFDDGFTRRALLGTVVKAISFVIPQIMTYKGIAIFCWTMSICFIIVLYSFVKYVLNKTTDEKKYRLVYIFSLFVFTFVVPATLNYDSNLGRADIIQMMLVILQVYLIIEKKYEWLTPFITFINVLFHEGFLCMMFPVLLATLVYYIFVGNNKKKYISLMLFNIIFMAVPAIASIFFVQPGTINEFYSKLSLSTYLNENSLYHIDILTMLSNYNNVDIEPINIESLVNMQFMELPIFLVLFIPVLLIIVKFIYKYVKELKTNKALYISILLIGPILISVEFIMFCDFGRYLWWLYFYYGVVFLMLMKNDDQLIYRCMSQSISNNNIKIIIAIVISLIYQPIPVTYFSIVSGKIASIIY